MKKLILVLAILGLVAGCASHDYSGGTEDSFHNNATYGTGSGAALSNPKADADNNM